MKQRHSHAAAALAVLAIGTLLLAERRWPRRPRPDDDSNGDRLTTNLALGAGAMLVVSLAEQPLAGRLAARVAARRQGLAQALPGPAWLRDIAGVVLLDGATYAWHVATHRVPLLWRLHAVHHRDRTLDASTALRFHPLDMAVMVPLRLAEVRLLGVSPRALRLYSAWFFGHVLFHHANIGLKFDRALSWVVTTPGMHDIHHRADEAATDANYSSGLSLWDRLFGTFSARRPAVPIGVPGGAALPAPGLADSLALPFAAAPLASRAGSSED